MTFPKARLAVAICLFLGWLGFLGYLVYERNLVILSRPQFAVAQAIVVVEIADEESVATIKEIAWCPDKKYRTLLEKDVELPELLSCGKGQGFQGPGVYIIPLIRNNTYFQIAPVRTPGFSRNANPSHATLRIVKLGARPERVLQRLALYPHEKPRHGKGLLEPLTVPMVERSFTRFMFPYLGTPIHFAPVELAHGLPIGDAKALEAELSELDATVEVRQVELRIYPATAQTRAQLAEIVKAKTQ